eukprot:Amastigsp_a626_63.p4 type:complete len:104 gc:universal Amastigsp_a626_63:773-462(-)
MRASRSRFLASGRIAMYDLESARSQICCRVTGICIVTELDCSRPKFSRTNDERSKTSRQVPCRYCGEVPSYSSYALRMSATHFVVRSSRFQIRTSDPDGASTR